MPLYEYKCKNCNAVYESFTRGLEDVTPCADCATPIKRVFSVSLQTPLHDHFNHAVGKYVTGKRQLRDEFKRASDDATERTGIEHNFVPVDPHDKETFGVTEEGLAETHNRKVQLGLKEPTPRMI